MNDRFNCLIQTKNALFSGDYPCKYNCVYENFIHYPLYFGFNLIFHYMVATLSPYRELYVVIMCVANHFTVA